MNNSYARNLKKSELGGVIFGCANNTIKECLLKQLFGLPAQHFSYVKNIDPGLPLFLFNYSNRKLHGIFEAASCGQMNINPYGWTTNGAERTQYPAQVQIHIRLQCQALNEEQFKPIIVNNYYIRNHFWFELDHVQTSKLVTLFSSLAVAPSASVPRNTEKWRNMRGQFEMYRPVTSSLDGDKLAPAVQSDAKVVDPKDLVLKQLQELALNYTSQDSSVMDGNHIEDTPSIETHLEEKCFSEEQMHPEKNEQNTCTSSDCQSIIAQLVQGMTELMDFKAEMERKLVESEKEIRQLKERCMVLESMHNPPVVHIDENVAHPSDELDLDITEAIHLVGGYDGNSWLAALDLYFPSHDVIRSLTPMGSVRSYASVARLNYELYVFGGGDGHVWYDTVESYNPVNNQWTQCASLTKKKGSLAGVTLNDNIYAIGGGNGKECFSDVEMLDLDVGRWIPTRSMLEKRFALAAAEINGVLYATGGFDGNNYLMSAERFDPREHSWSRIASMNTRRGCHALVVLNEKLYALGGFDGRSMVHTTEVFDPRLGSWITGDPMNKSRGYSAANVVKDTIYLIGGLESDENIVDTIEYFKEGEGWKEKKSKAIKRCFLSSIVL